MNVADHFVIFDGGVAKYYCYSVDPKTFRYDSNRGWRDLGDIAALYTEAPFQTSLSKATRVDWRTLHFDDGTRQCAISQFCGMLGSN